ESKPIRAGLRHNQKKTEKAQSIGLAFTGASLLNETLTDSGETHSTIDCSNGNCIALTAFETHTRIQPLPGTVRPRGVYHGPWQPDTLWRNTMGFVGRDTLLIFISKDWGMQTDMACAALFRPAPINKYFQLDGLVTDYYMDNDSMAASFNYDKGNLEGPAYIFYPGG